MSRPEKAVVFVCLGNICRSPAAEGVFRKLVVEKGLENGYRIESRGIGSWHVGEPPDDRMRQAARSRGVSLESRALQIKPEDFERFDLILSMDASVHADLVSRCPPPHRQKVRPFRSFDPKGSGDVPDPYYGGPAGFEEVLDIAERTSAALLAHLEAAS